MQDITIVYSYYTVILSCIHRESNKGEVVTDPPGQHDTLKQTQVRDYQ